MNGHLFLAYGKIKKWKYLELMVQDNYVNLQTANLCLEKVKCIALQNTSTRIFNLHTRI